MEFKKISYNSIINAIRTGEGLWGTIEVEPAYGKYHFDGHRTCNIMQDPAITRKKGKICPVCKRELTIGVLYRVDELADRKKPANQTQHEIKLLPLSEIIAMILGKGLATKKVWDEYWKILKAGKNEFDILLNVSEEDLLRATENKDIVKAIINLRKGKITIDPAGYDGVYGVPVIPGVALNTDVVKGD
jgi:PHP family Zn ribbon phosphoesterase